MQGIEIVPEDNIFELAKAIKVMKPNKIAKDNLTQQVKLDKILDSDEYAAEEKIDGCHYKMVGCRFFSTEDVEKTDNYPHLRDFFIQLGMPNLILDGEINYPGKTSQYCLSVTGSGSSNAIAFQNSNDFIHYTIFDILRTPKNTWLTKYTYAERRHLLEHFYTQYIKDTPMEKYIHLSNRTTENKKTFLKNILDRAGEGIVLKRLDSLYLMGKKPMWQWMKIKQNDETDLIITDFIPPKKHCTATNLEKWEYWVEEGGIRFPVTKFYAKGWIGAIELSAYLNGTLTKICTCSGMTEATRIDMTNHPEKYLNRVAKVTFMEKTTAGFPRHPSFEGMHESKKPEECIWELQN